MFDEKYMESHDKKIETVEDALIVVLASDMCGGVSCDECVRRMYGDGDCSHPKRDAERWLSNNGYRNVKAQQLVYERLFAKPEPKPEETPAISQGTCATCMNSEMHCSGIRWCKSFSNFTHDDGYCYRYDANYDLLGGESDV